MAGGDIQAIAPDGSTHIFPQGTADSVIDGAMKRYITGGQAAPSLDTALRTGKGIQQVTAQPTTAVPGGKTAGAILPPVHGDEDYWAHLAPVAPGSILPADKQLNLGDVQRGSEESAHDVGTQARLYDERLASESARTGRPATFGEEAGSYGRHAAATTARIASGMLSPVALTTGAIAPHLPLVGGAIGAYEGAKMLAPNFEGALKGDPDALENAFLGASMLAGSGATMLAPVKPGFDAARLEGASIPEAIGRGLAETPEGRAVSAVNRNVLQPVADRITPPPAPQALRQAIQPGMNIPKIDQSIPIAGARIQQLRQAGALVDRNGEPLTEIKSPAQLVDAVQASKAHIWAKLDEMLGREGSTAQADTSPVADAMERSISGRTSKQFSGEAGAIQKRAQTYRGEMSLREIESAIQDANDDLKGFYQRSTSSSAPTSAGMRATLAEVKALRSLLDEKVTELRGPGFQQLKQEYGALRDVERAGAKAEFVSARQRGVPLYEALAMLRAAGDFVTGNVLGGAKGAATISMGRYLTKLRDPNFLIERSFHGPQAFKAAEPIAAAPAPKAPRGLLGKAPLITPQPADTSGSFEAESPYIEPTTRPERMGLLLPERTALITPPTTSESAVRGYQAPPISMRGKEGQFTRGYASTAGPQQRGTQLGQIARVGNERWSWDGEKWSRMEPSRASLTTKRR